MIGDLGQEGFLASSCKLLRQITNRFEDAFVLGCITFTRLSAVLSLVNLNARFGWSEKSFTELLVLLKTMLPKDNLLLKSHYEAKKILCLVGMEY